MNDDIIANLKKLDQHNREIGDALMEEIGAPFGRGYAATI
jgi:hypothetical protein